MALFFDGNDFEDQRNRQAKIRQTVIQTAGTVVEMAVCRFLPAM